MNNKCRLLDAILAFVFLLIVSPFAFAQEAQPGDPCVPAEEHRFQHVGGPENPGTGYTLVCDGTEWKLVTEWSTSSGQSLFQVGNDTDPCDTDKTGRLRYDSGADEWQYCDGSAWGPFEQAGGSAGTPCTDDESGECLLTVSSGACLDPIAGLSAGPTITANNTTGTNYGSSLETATLPATFHMNITLPSPLSDGVILESGAAGQGLGLWIDGSNLVFAVGNGSVTSTTTDAIFISHDLTGMDGDTIDVVAAVHPTDGQAVLYIDDCFSVYGETTNQTALAANEWAGTDAAGYGIVAGGIRNGAPSANFISTNGTLNSDMIMYGNQLPTNFPDTNVVAGRSINDLDFVAENIRLGTNILGIVGTYDGPQCDIKEVVLDFRPVIRLAKL